MSINNKISYFSLLILAVFQFSCTNRHDGEPVINTLRFDAASSTNDKPFFRDSLVITYFQDDSLVVSLYDNSIFHVDCYYYRFDNMLFEERYVSNLPKSYFGVDMILSFCTHDTTFLYKSKRDDMIVTLIDLSFHSSRYTIVKEGKWYKTIKQSLIDTTYSEIFYYDKDFRINKFLTSWRGDTSVYSLYAKVKMKV